jgi:hypothetical protein
MNNDKTNIITREKSIEIAKVTFDWCLSKFGNPLKTLEPKLNVSFDRRVKNYYGNYSDRVVSVFPIVCGDERTIILTVLHEFRHFLQMPKIHNMSQYYKLFEKYNYENHPLEIDAIKFQKEHYSSCRRTLKRKGVI